MEIKKNLRADAGQGGSLGVGCGGSPVRVEVARKSRAKVRVVPANKEHPDYDTSLAGRLRARDVIDGEDAVKLGSIKYKYHPAKNPSQPRRTGTAVDCSDTVA